MNQSRRVFLKTLLGGAVACSAAPVIVKALPVYDPVLTLAEMEKRYFEPMAQAIHNEMLYQHIRIIRQFNPNENRSITRMDVLYGQSARPEHYGRIVG